MEPGRSGAPPPPSRPVLRHSRFGVRTPSGYESQSQRRERPGGVWLGGCTDRAPQNLPSQSGEQAFVAPAGGRCWGLEIPGPPVSPVSPAGGPGGTSPCTRVPAQPAVGRGTPGGSGNPLCPFPGVNQPALGMRRGSNGTQAGSPWPRLGQARRAGRGVHPQGLGLPLSLNLVTERSPEAWQGPAGTAGSSGSPRSLQTGTPLHTGHAHPAESRSPGPPHRQPRPG